MGLSEKEHLIHRLSVLPKERLSQQDKIDIHQIVQREIEKGPQPRLRSTSIFRRSAAKTTVTAVAGLAIAAGATLYVVDPRFLHARQSTANQITVPFAQSSSVLTGVKLFHQSGWLNVGNGTLLHTTDNGAHWRTVTPPLTSRDQDATITVLNAKVAWLAVGTIESQHAYVTILRTTDGGQSWRTSTLKGEALPHLSSGQVPGYLSFINQKNGWMVTQVPDFGMGGTSPGALYRTSNGGATWRLVSNDVAAGLVSFKWLDFVTPQLGFTVAAKQAAADAGVTDGNPDRLFMTNDGGLSWKPAAINLPAGKFVNLLMPTFFTRESGVLPVVTRQGGASSLQLYRTTDGGRTWIKSGNVHVIGTSGSLVVAFVSVKEGYLLDGSTLFGTKNSGVKWEKVGTISGQTQNDVISMAFQDSAVGWVYALPNTFVDPNGKTGVLYKTMDSGRTWNQVPIRYH